MPRQGRSDLLCYLKNGVQTAVGVSAVPLIAANDERTGLFIQNLGPGHVRVGTIGVTTTTGLQVRAWQTLEFDRVPLNAIYAVAESDTSNVVALEMG
jgi:hypothetical protein